jgi:hypothetical protein
MVQHVVGAELDKDEIWIVLQRLVNARVAVGAGVAGVGEPFQTTTL